MLRLVRAATNSLREMVAIYLLVVSMFAVSFWVVEEVNLKDSFYWAFTTVTTTGYGDILPKTDIGKSLAVLLMQFGSFAVGPLLVFRLVTHLDENRDKFSHEEQEEEKQERRDMKAQLNRIEKHVMRSIVE